MITLLLDYDTSSGNLSERDLRNASPVRLSPAWRNTVTPS